MVPDWSLLIMDDRKITRPNHIHQGFTLVEMAIVLLIMGVVLSGLFVSLGQSTENTRRLEAKSKLREIEESLYGFAQVQGRLPCPADDNTNGTESVSGTTTNGICGLQHGMLPNATLGLSGGVDENGFLLDPWGNPYRYSVAGQTPGSGTSRRYTGTTGIQDIYDNAASNIVNGANILEVCNNVACSDVIMSNVVPAVVLTMGNNWGSIATASANEKANAYNATTSGGDYDVTNNVTFVVADYSEENFDDMLTWISPHVLFSKMLAAGKLP